MSESYPTEAELADAIESAAERAINDLFAQHPGHYYYLSLITTGQAHPPTLAAWSIEALDAAVKDPASHFAAVARIFRWSKEKLEKQVKDAVDNEDFRWGLKWSYADSPFLCFGDQYFQQVKDLIAKRPWDDRAWETEYELRLRAMEAAISRLDRMGLFGTGQDRWQIILNVEVMPPDYTNTQRAKRLNPPEALRTWLAEAAEPEPES